MIDQKLIIEYLDAHLKTYAARYALPELSCQMFSEKEIVNRAAGFLTFQIVHRVYGLGEAQQTVRFQVPATWVDAFKLHYMYRLPRWITKRWKVKYKTLSQTVTARALLPTVPVRAGEHVVRFVAVKGEERCGTSI